VPEITLSDPAQWSLAWAAVIGTFQAAHAVPQQVACCALESFSACGVREVTNLFLSAMLPSLDFGSLCFHILVTCEF